MAIKNYTSTVPMINSIQRIEHRLAQAGASHIAKTYSDGKPIGMVFQIVDDGIPRTFKLPAKTERVFDWLKLQRKKPPTKAQMEQLKAQADRTGWKILSDWIDIQISLIELKQADVREVFLPYMYDPTSDATLFERLDANNFQFQLGVGKNET